MSKIRTLAVGVVNGIPMEKIKACMRMDDLSDEILDRLYDGKAVPLDKVRELNELFYKTFPERQDGEEFTESESTVQAPLRVAYREGYKNALECVKGYIDDRLQHKNPACDCAKGGEEK